MKDSLPIIRFFIFLLVLSVSFSRCKDDGQNTGNKSQQKISNKTDSLIFHQRIAPYFTKIFDTDTTSVLRGFNFGQPQQAIKNAENERLEFIQQSNDHLYYEFNLFDDTIGTDYAELKYFFDSKGLLDIITVNYFINDSIIIEEFSEYLLNRFEEKYGHFYIDNDGYTVWENTYMDKDNINKKYDIAVKKLIKLNDPGLTIEYAKF